jgi:ATPase subunit of ABC transporter with duplicated ATPase domains
MTLINIRNLGVTLSAPLFSRLNLVVNAGDRIGLVAANGRGKSTLLRCLAGTMEASEGEITRSRGLKVGYVEQDVPKTLMDRPFYAAVLETLSTDQRLSERWRVDVALESLEVPEALRQRPLKHLSGGWQRLAMLARVLVTGADVLLLDEPTNHCQSAFKFDPASASNFDPLGRRVLAVALAPSELVGVAETVRARAA